MYAPFLTGYCLATAKLLQVTNLQHSGAQQIGQLVPIRLVVLAAFLINNALRRGLLKRGALS